MNGFRLKPSTSHSPRLPRSHHSQNIEDEWFPLKNMKLIWRAKEQDLLTVKNFKSRAHITRKKYEYIPLLKNISHPTDKVSIVKSAKNQYNLFMRQKYNPKQSNSTHIINGLHLRAKNKQDQNIPKHIISQTIDGTHHFNSLSLRGHSSDSFGKMYNHYNGLHTLHVDGESKCISPSRVGHRRKFSETNFGQTKI